MSDDELRAIREHLFTQLLADGHRGVRLAERIDRLTTEINDPLWCDWEWKELPPPSSQMWPTSAARRS